ncbi:hypothetical protein JK636_01935 [Clostridium sp. YIM B02515]|uniref:Zinc ribbon domain-containing protein n=1 Tax=Clostridium rhizosphaerae TaxID=2803861 RepID=A0ABS1T5A8_9CLOT|nr:DUF6320 domain-containing protein [Clostridium rhizosphaerae]MBL4934514.1 hypothetical protein [Clostridium rhizosphaerae]
MKCENCKIETNNITNNCPLCGKYLFENDSEYKDVYPRLGEKPLKERGKLFKWLLFSTFIYTIFIFGLNLITPHKYYWSIIPIFAVWMLWILFGVPIIKGKLAPLMMIFDNVIISILLIAIDTTFSLKGWTLSYIGPFVPLATAFIITIIVVCLKTTWKEFYSFQMTIAAVCCLPIVIKLLYSFKLWPSIVSALYGIVTILAMIIFGDKKFKYEAKKRLHF